MRPKKFIWRAAAAASLLCVFGCERVESMVSELRDEARAANDDAGASGVETPQERPGSRGSTERSPFSPGSNGPENTRGKNTAAELVATPPAEELARYEYPEPFVREDDDGVYVTITLRDLRRKWEGEWPPTEQRSGESTKRNLAHFLWRVPEYRSNSGWEIRWVDEFGIPPALLATRDEREHPDGVSFEAKNRRDKRVCLQFSLRPRMPKGHNSHIFAPPQYIFEPGEVRQVELRYDGWADVAELSEGKLLIVTPRYKCSGSHVIDRDGKRTLNPDRQADK